MWQTKIGDQWGEKLIKKGLLIELIVDPDRNPQEKYHLSSENAMMLEQKQRKY